MLDPLSVGEILKIKKELQEPITAEKIGSYLIRIEWALELKLLVEECLKHEGHNTFCGTIYSSLKQTFKLGMSLKEALLNAQP